jgi:hypothetical protein
MSTFLLRGEPILPTKISLQTHCPAMVRANVAGATYKEEICRCDVVRLKKEIHPARCSSISCPVQLHINATGQTIENERKYELL